MRRPAPAWSAAWLAWSCFALGVALFALAQVLTTEYRGGPTRAALLLYAAVGALIASRRPRNPIGWLFLAIALSYEMYSAASVVGNERLRTTGSIADLEPLLWLPMNLWLFSFGLAPLLFLYFPNGRLISPRWRVLAAVAMLTALTGTLTISSTGGAVATRSPISSGRRLRTASAPSGVP